MSEFIQNGTVASLPLSSNLTGKDIIDDALTITKGNREIIRPRFLTWLNITAGKLAVVRPWLFLSNGSATLTPSANVITKPVGFGQIKSIKGGTDFFLTPADKLSDEEAWRLGTSDFSPAQPRGYTETATTITLCGSAYTTSVVLAYTIEPPVISDSTTATVWPSKCRMLFMRSLLDFFYEYDMDERAALGYQLNAGEMKDLKKWDNSQKPKPKPSRHGYVRTA